MLCTFILVFCLRISQKLLANVRRSKTHIKNSHADVDPDECSSSADSSTAMDNPRSVLAVWALVLHCFQEMQYRSFVLRNSCVFSHTETGRVIFKLPRKWTTIIVRDPNYGLLILRALHPTNRGANCVVRYSTIPLGVDAARLRCRQAPHNHFLYVAEMLRQANNAQWESLIAP